MMTPEQFEAAVSVVRYHFREVGELEEEAVLVELIAMGLSPVSDAEVLEVVHEAVARAEYFADHGVLPRPDLMTAAPMGRC